MRQQLRSRQAWRKLQLHCPNDLEIQVFHNFLLFLTNLGVMIQARRRVDFEYVEILGRFGQRTVFYQHIYAAKS